MISEHEHTMLRACSLTKRFTADGTTITAVRGADLRLRRGEFAVVLGSPGSGKSTLLHLLGGLERPTSGQIWLHGQRVDGLSQARWAVLRRREIGFMFQFASLIENMTVADNVEVAALMGGASRRQAAGRREELLTELGLADRAGAAPARLPVSEQQQVALARAMAARPALLLADEPTGGLDIGATLAVQRLLARAHADGQSILLATRDSRVASAADRVISLFDGMVADDAPLPDVPRAAEGPGARSPVREVLRLRD